MGNAVGRHRMSVGRQAGLLAAEGIFALILLSTLFTPAGAQAVKNRVLTSYQIVADRKCSLIKVNFNHRIRYVSHFPVSFGTEVRIMLRAIDPRQFDLDGGLQREALRPPHD